MAFPVVVDMPYDLWNSMMEGILENLFISHGGGLGYRGNRWIFFFHLSASVSDSHGQVCFAGKV